MFELFDKQDFFLFVVVNFISHLEMASTKLKVHQPEMVNI
jgi:hypothetical protein